MTSAERVQLDAFARVDGVILASLWICSFACYIAGLTNNMLGMAAVVMVVASPFLIARRLRRFRDYAREGIISFRRGWAYVILVFFYGGLLLALAQYVYFAYMDHGYLVSAIGQMMQTAEFNELMASYDGAEDSFRLMLAEFQKARPIDLALQGLTTNIMIGIVLGMPIAAFMRSGTASAKH